MEQGFIKFRKNQVVQVSNITCVWESKNKEKSICFSTVDSTLWHVEPEYEQEWRDRFDLNDKE